MMGKEKAAIYMCVNVCVFILYEFLYRKPFLYFSFLIPLDLNESSLLEGVCHMIDCLVAEGEKCKDG